MMMERWLMDDQIEEKIEKSNISKHVKNFSVCRFKD